MAKQKIVTQEEIEQNRLVQVLDGIEKVPDPTYLHKIGDSVHIGNLEDCIIIDILENGKVYKIDYTRVDNNYGRPIRNEHVISYWKWLDVHPIVLENHNLIKNEDLILNYSQRQMMDIFGKRYYFGIEMTPEYQRDYVWELSDKQLLIDSIFNNIDIGKFVFIKMEWNNHPLHCAYEILDGKQRIEAICSFYEGRFSYKNLLYKDLSKHEKNHFENYSISSAEISRTTEKQKLEYFLKLNRTGKVMSNEQLNKVENMLKDMNV